ncbi:MAG: hypothetical protein M3279_11755 [Actinomycetota bacterium]|nr:hypothetical protein [Actinomycetota bacterium]
MNHAGGRRLTTAMPAIPVVAILLATLVSCTEATPDRSRRGRRGDATPPAASPSGPPGGEIAFVRAGPRVVRYPGGNDIPENPEVFVLRFGRRGGVEEVLNVSRDDRNLDASPVWSPDGDVVAFVRSSLGRPPRPEVWAMRPDGSDKAVLRECSGRCEGLGNLDWSTTGELAFTDFDNVLHLEPTESRRGRVVVAGDRASRKTIDVQPDGWTGIQYLTWSPDGSKLAFALIGEKRGLRRWLHVFDVGTRDLSRVSGPGFNSPSWSPDGRSIAAIYNPRRSGPYAEGQIYLMGSDGTDPRPLVPCSEPCRDARPSFSPDGDWIVFDRKGDLFVAPVDGSAEPRRITDGPSIDCCARWD